MKNSKRGYLVLAILFIVVSVVSYAVPTIKTSTFWIAYAFTVISFAVQPIMWRYTLGREKTLRSKFLGLSIVTLGIVYLILQIIALIVFTFAFMLPSWISVVACVVLLGILTACIIATDAAKEEIEKIDEKADKKVFSLRSVRTDVEIIANNEPDQEIKKKLLDFAENLRFSDPISTETVVDIENRILAKVEELKTAENKETFIADLNSLLNERNEKIKIMK